MYLIFDTETTGLPKNFRAPITDTDNWPRCIQIAWQLHADDGSLIENQDFLVQPEGFEIPFQSQQIHGISTDLAHAEGKPLNHVIEAFQEVLKKTKCLVGQNLKFDLNVMGCEFHRLSKDNSWLNLPVLDTCTETTALLCQLKGGRGGKFKLPTLSELHLHLFKDKFEEAHNATADVEATARCFFELIRIKSFSTKELLLDQEQYAQYLEKNNDVVQPIGLKHVNLFKASKALTKKQPEQKPKSNIDTEKVIEELIDVPFSHLHNRTQFSVLQSTIQVKNLINKAIEYQMPAVAFSDNGNMMAAFQFVETAAQHNDQIDHQIKDLDKDDDAEIKQLENKKILPIVGCEFHVCHDRTDKSYKDNGFQVPFLAKNKNGYQNLIKLSSLGFVEGFYYVPRIDKNLILDYKEDVIVTTGGIYGEIPQLILNEGEASAEKSLLWWKEHFKDDFYIELTRHGLEEEDKVNEVLLRLAEKHDVKYFASNNTYYLNKDDADAHDVLLCIKDGERKSTPKGRGRGFRFGFSNNEYYFKSQNEMKALFADYPEAIKTTNEIIAKCSAYRLAAEVLLPEFEIPEEFKDEMDQSNKSLKIGENNFLRHLTYKGAEKRYDKITEEIKERLDFELEIIRNTGYPGYFLIVQDFCNAAREMGVSVGPGRGSAAGSAVAYCTGITNVDPIEYNLLFERFLNPDRVSLPDIDIDFDDEGRPKVIQYVIDKYGSSQVAQIITYGTMAAKSSIRDTGRVLDLSLPETDRLAKLVPDVKLNKLFNWSKEEVKENLNADQYKNAEELINKLEEEALVGRNDVIVYDSESHACMVDGVRLHQGKRKVFLHNDMDSFDKQMAIATKLVEQSGGGILVVTEGVFGMSGDQGRLKEIIDFRKSGKYEFRLFVDDAHGFGTLGDKGQGAGEYQGVQEEIDVLFGTFAKSMASVGAFVCSTEDVINYLAYNMRSQIFAKSLPMPLVIGALKRLELLKGKEQREKLWTITNALQSGLKAAGFSLGNSNTCVTPVMLSGTLGEATNLTYDLRENHSLFCSIVVYPVVPKGMILLRLIPTASHSLENVEYTLDIFKKIKVKLDNGDYHSEKVLDTNA